MDTIVSGSYFKPSKDRYKLVTKSLIWLMYFLFQTLKGSLQTTLSSSSGFVASIVSNPQRIATNRRRPEERSGAVEVSNPQRIATNSSILICVCILLDSFKPSKDRYKHREFAPLLITLLLFQTLKGSLQTFRSPASTRTLSSRFKPSKDRYKQFFPAPPP